MDLKLELCRTCLTSLTNNIHHSTLEIYSIFNTENLAHKLMICSSSIIETTDEYPQQVCLECYNKILQFYEFQKMCCESLEKFKKLLDIPGEVKEECQLEQISEKDPLDKDIKLDGILEQEELIDVALYTNSVEGKNQFNRTIQRKKIKAPQKKVIPQKEKKATKAIRSCRNVENKYVNTAEYETEILQYPPDKFKTENSESEVMMDTEVMSNRIHSKRKFNNAEGDKLMNNMKMQDNTKSNIPEKEISNSDSESDSSEHQSKTASKTNRYKCDRCTKSFSYEYRLDGHKRQHDGLAPYPCTFEGCERTFKRWHYFQEHLKDHNGQQKLQYKCDIDNCQRIYKCRSNLNIHKRKYHHQGPELKSHMCEVCGKVFKTSTILNDHRYTHIDRDQFPYVCDDETGCTKRFSTKLKLKIHKMRHAGIKNFICPYCGMRKTTRNELRIHINYHTLERTWPCKFCSKVFNSAGNLKGHVKSIHERAKDFACSFCERTFAKADTKKYHEMTHTGEKPHVCKDCGRRFVQPAALRTHKKIHLRTKPKAVPEVYKDNSVANILNSSKDVQSIEESEAMMVADLLNDNNTSID